MKRITILLIIGISLMFAASCGLSAEANNDAQSGNYRTSGDDLVIVVDAGHGGGDNGTTGNFNGTTYYEKNLNLKVAEYLWESLSGYGGVKVYMTRQDDTKLSILTRVKMAADLNADLMVSMHMNALEGASSFGGSEIFVPKGNYRPALAARASDIATNILNRFEELGMRNIGVKTSLMDSDPFYNYPNGAQADYYGIIRYCVNENIPSMIIEHGYLSNKNDMQFLASDSNLKRLAEAAAKSIADSYGLTPGSGNKITLRKQQPVTISDIPTNLSVGQQPIDLSAYGGSGNGEMRFESNDNAVLRISGNKLIIYGEGTANITAVKGCDGTYLPAQSENHIRITVLATGRAPVTAPPTATPYKEPYTYTPNTTPEPTPNNTTGTGGTGGTSGEAGNGGADGRPSDSEESNESIGPVEFIKKHLYTICAAVLGIAAAITIAVIVGKSRANKRKKSAARYRSSYESLYSNRYDSGSSRINPSGKSSGGKGVSRRSSNGKSSGRKGSDGKGSGAGFNPGRDRNNRRY